MDDMKKIGGSFHSRAVGLRGVNFPEEELRIVMYSYILNVAAGPPHAGMPTINHDSCSSTL